MKKGLYVTILGGIAAALLIGGCDFLLGPNEPVGGGNLAIAFGENGNRAAAPADLERYDVVLTGPKEQKITLSLGPEQRFYQEVALGEWHLDAKAYNAGNVLIGTGSITVTVKPGRNEVRIPMRRVPVPDTYYTVTFDTNGGSAAPEAQTVVEGSKATEPAAPTKAGYIFGGWFREMEMVNQWNFATDTVTADITLYAKWSTVTYTVTFDTNGGSAAPEAQTVAEGSKAT
ncbi:MAG: InlB B-repeat-containing protein, partial [Treponema sp.]|nr:InlB B-repeat-containing protein [Treponema sp.]